MILDLEAWMHISESAWSAWMQTYQFLTYQTDELSSQKSLVPASIQKNPGISLKQVQQKYYACQVHGLLKYYHYYININMNTELPYPFVCLITRKRLYATLLIYICHRNGVVRKDPDMLFAGIL